MDAIRLKKYCGRKQLIGKTKTPVTIPKATTLVLKKVSEDTYELRFIEPLRKLSPEDTEKANLAFIPPEPEQ